MTPSAYALVGLTALVAGLIAMLVFAVLRFAAAARDVRRHASQGDAERAFVSAALQDAIGKLREQERAMATRAESSERLNSQIVSSLTSGLLVVDMYDHVRMLNPAGRRLLNLPDFELSTPFGELLESAEPLVEVVTECLASGRPVVRRSMTIDRGPAARAHLGVTVSPLSDDQGGLHGAVCLFSDLTAVIELEEQVRLKESLARLGELTAGLAHEFRNGLATIHGYSRLVDLELLPAAQAPYVQAIRDETDALGRVVANFLNFARPVQLAFAPIQSGKLVEFARSELASEAKARGGDIAVRGEFGTIDGDEVLLRQALVNLVRNAIEACADANVNPRIAIEGRVDVPSGVLKLRVSDNGPGIPAGSEEKLFHPFFTTKRQGTGLGLALVQKIAVSHNGRVLVGPSDDGGASFTLVLPLTTSV
ncbi:MAG: PAS domain-containing protein [Acidobacteria bacterium]|nr:MAG: PAS domain-containing protein [Acidobacteriota bacterium]